MRLHALDVVLDLGRIGRVGRRLRRCLGCGILGLELLVLRAQSLDFRIGGIVRKIVEDVRFDVLRLDLVELVGIVAAAGGERQSG